MIARIGMCTERHSPVTGISMPLWMAPLAVALVLSFLSPGWGQQVPEAAFVRGDANIDGDIDISDAVQMLFCGFLGTGCSSCADATDVNDDGVADISDPIHLLTFLFKGGEPVPQPAGACGADPTADDLGCTSYPRCVSEDGIATSRGELLVIPIDHASLALRWHGKTILVDPVGGAAKYAELPAPDLVLLTHEHSDHMDATTLKALVQQGTVLVDSAAVSRALASSGVLDIVEEKVLANGETVEIAAIGVNVEAVPMYNLTADRLKYHPKGNGSGYVLDLDGTRVYIAGDTEDTPEMRALEDIDLAFLCMNLPYTMTVQQAASATLEFRPGVVYPYHYRGENPETYKGLVEAASDDIEVRVRDWYP